MKIIPKIDYKEALKEYVDNYIGTFDPETEFYNLWHDHPKSIRIIYGWFLAYQDVLDWIAESMFKNHEDIYIYPAFTKNACTKDGKVFFGIKRDYNHNLDFGIVIHELMHILYKEDEAKTESKTIEVVKKVNDVFHLNINHGTNV